MTDRVAALIREFTAKLEAEIRGQVRADLDRAISNALGAGSRRNGTRARAARPAGKNGRRSPEQMAAVTQRLLTHIRANPGQRAEQIGKALGFGTGEMALPLKKLVEDKQLKTKGKARGTTYTVAG